MNRNYILDDIVRTLITKLGEGENKVILDRSDFENLFLFALQGVNIIKNITNNLNESFDYPKESDGWVHIIGDELSDIIKDHLKMEGFDKN